MGVDGRGCRPAEFAKKIGWPLKNVLGSCTFAPGSNLFVFPLFRAI